jgi:hypothetical protein
MHIVFRDNLNNVEIEDWGQWHRTIVAIETLKPITESPLTKDVFDELFLMRESIDLPFELKKSMNQADFLEKLKSIFVVIRHDNFKLRISIINKINKQNMLIGGILKILARHASEYNKYHETDASIFQSSFILPDIIAKLISCRSKGTLEIENISNCYTYDDYKLVTRPILNGEIEDIITFYPIN